MSRYVGPKTDAAHLATQGDLGGGGSPEAWRVVGATGQPTFQNSWSNFGGGYAAAAFYRDLERVHLRGLVTGGSGAIFTLPAGYRPPDILVFGSYTNAGQGRVDIGPTGSVVFQAGGSGYTVLNGISFRVA